MAGRHCLHATPPWSSVRRAFLAPPWPPARPLASGHRLHCSSADPLALPSISSALVSRHPRGGSTPVSLLCSPIVELSGTTQLRRSRPTPSRTCLALAFSSATISDLTVTPWWLSVLVDAGENRLVLLRPCSMTYAACRAPQHLVVPSSHLQPCLQCCRVYV